MVKNSLLKSDSRGDPENFTTQYIRSVVHYEKDIIIASVSLSGEQEGRREGPIEERLLIESCSVLFEKSFGFREI